MDTNHVAVIALTLTILIYVCLHVFQAESQA
jgi:hypothetical protein